MSIPAVYLLEFSPGFGLNAMGLTGFIVGVYATEQAAQQAINPYLADPESPSYVERDDLTITRWEVKS